MAIFLYLTLLTVPLYSAANQGIQATEGQFPYQVSIRSSNHHICSGAIINSKWVITSHVCVRLVLRSLHGSKIRIGTNHLDNGRDYGIEKGAIHTPERTNDVGLIKVSENIQFDQNVEPIEMNRDEIGEGIAVIFSGWDHKSGDPMKDLHYISTITTSEGPCNRIFPTQLCTLAFVQTGDCLDDSGAPLVTDGKLIGIGSFRVPCASGFPEVFARITTFLHWIDETIQTN